MEVRLVSAPRGALAGLGAASVRTAPRTRRARRAAGVVFAVGLALAPGRAVPAQSLSRGTLRGDVSGPDGRPLRGAVVHLREGDASRAGHSVETGADGRFEFSLLVPGEYELFVERLGYRPKRVRQVPVRPGRRTEVSVSLEPSEPPVREAAVVAFNGAALGGARAGIGWWLSPFELSQLPDASRDAGEAARDWTGGAGWTSVEGWPGRVVPGLFDGFGFEPARHSDLGASALGFAAFPLGALRYAEWVTNGVDGEWGEPMPVLAGYTRRGGARWAAEAYGTWSGDALAISSVAHAPARGYGDVRGGLVVGGPLIPDTAHVVFGVEARHAVTPFPAAWEDEGPNAALRSVVHDTLLGGAKVGVGLDGYLGPRTLVENAVAAFARFDWRMAPGHELTVQGHVAAVLDADPDLDLGPSRSASLGARVKGTDVWVAAGLASVFARGWAQELRVAVERSRRDYVLGADFDVEELAGANLPATILVEPAVRFGGDVTLPGGFRRTALRASETVHYRSGAHRYKVGVGAVVASHDITYAYGRGGEYAFSDLARFARLEGAYVETVGPLPVAEFSTSRLFAFLQDTWTAVPGFDLTLGLRFDLDVQPVDELLPNVEWRDRTRLENAGVRKTRSRWGPRAGFEWDVRGDRSWIVRAAAGLYHGPVDPGVWAEAITGDGRLAVRRAVGALGLWRVAADSAIPAWSAPTLTLVAPEMEGPRTARASLGITTHLGPSAAVHVSGAYRRTDFLPRRTDLNLLPEPVGRDPHGRPIYGRLIQLGGLVVAEPGSNRRFSDFDVVSGLSADGRSEYWELTLALERRTGDWLSFVGSYTYSRAEDNWLGGTPGGPADELDPFPQGLEGREWADGRSDFDVPHRLLLAAEVRVPAGAGVRLGFAYRLRSGDPFTPSFPVGVDANGDGSWSNDPAYVDDAVRGVRELFSAWDCLRGQVGRFAERNACRGPLVHGLDLRVGIGLARLRRYAAELTVDVLNLIEPETGLRDRALYRVDPEGTLVTDETGGTVALPLVANPGFGRLLVRHAPGRTLRIGLRVRY